MNLIKILASSSKGNSYFIMYNNINILIDCGISIKIINEELSKYNITKDDINYLFITHEHTDHIKSIKSFINTKTLIYITEGTLKYIYYKLNLNNDFSKNFSIIKKLDNFLYKNIDISDISFIPFRLHHDSEEPVGFKIEFKSLDKTLSLITDTGFISNDIINLCKNSTYYFLESNYDTELLFNSQRPLYLINRIISDYGHLSNTQSILSLKDMIGQKSLEVIFCHISQDCNNIDTIKKELDILKEEFNINIKISFSKPDGFEEILI